MSITYISNNIGPRTNPCGTPVVIILELENTCPTNSDCEEISDPFMNSVLFYVHKISLRQTMSKAFGMSQNTVYISYQMFYIFAIFLYKLIVKFLTVSYRRGHLNSDDYI